jgi:hypothetical protein
VAMASALGEIAYEVPNMRVNMRLAMFQPNRVNALLEKLEILYKRCVELRPSEDRGIDKFYTDVPVETICMALAPSVYSVFLHTQEQTAIKMGHIVVNDKGLPLVKTCYNDDGMPDEDVNRSDDDADKEIDDADDDKLVDATAPGMSKRDVMRILRAIDNVYANDQLTELVLKYSTESSAENLFERILKKFTKRGDTRMIEAVKRVRAELAV